MAQDRDDDEAIEEIIVTGTRLKNTALSSPVPVLQVSATDISDRGVVRLEEMLNILPQVEANQNATVSNGASGTSALNLRGLEPERTLVLLNGRRLPFGSPRFSPVNVDFVPAALVERVDVVTGGGSAVYGSDAVGGIANFILKDDFEGIAIDGQVGIHHAPNQSALMHDILSAANIDIPDAAIDGREVAMSVTVGSNFASGRGNVTLSFGYQNANAITQDNRDFSACALSSRGGINGNHRCVGSSNFRKFTPGVGHGLRHINGTIFRPGDPGFDTATVFNEVFQEADGTLVVRRTSAETETFNFGPTNFFRRPNERYNINALANYEISDTIEAYLDLGFMNNFTDAQIAPSASFNRPFDTNCDNPLLQSGLGPTGPNPNGLTLFELFGCQQVLDDAALPPSDPNFRDNIDTRFTNSHRNVEGGNRNLAFRNTQWRVVTGLRGTLAEKFDWDLFGQVSFVNDSRQSTNDLDFNRVQQALFVVTDPASGNAVCRDPSNGCVPWNIFDRSASGDTLVTKAASDFVGGNGIVIGRTEQRVVGGTIQTDLTDYGLKSPMAETGASILGGFEYRRDSLKSIPDDLSQISGGRGLTGTGGGILPVAGQLSVWELFMEAQLPLVQGEAGIEDLSLSGAFRHSEYSTDGNGVKNTFGTNTFFVGGSWMPVSQVRVRAQFQRAIRAPNVIDLFTGQNTGGEGIRALPNGAFDPCGGPSPFATLAQCQNTGLTAAQFGLVPLSSGGLNTVTGGNPNLFAETSDTLTIGVVVTPEVVPGLSIAVDYYDITIDDALGTIPPQTTLDNCIATGNPVFCQLIVRDIFGSLFLDNSNFEGIQRINVNVVTLKTKGVDVQVDYDMELDDVGLEDMGSVNFSLAGTYTDEISTVPLPGEALVDCAGLFSGQCFAPTPRWRHVLRATWQTPSDLRTTLTWRYMGGTKNFFPITDPTDLNRRIPAANYIDLVFRYQAMEAVELRFGVNNLLAKQPHFLSQGSNGNTFPGQYDIDRFMFFGMNLTY